MSGLSFAKSLLLFQSTRPMRGATARRKAYEHKGKNFNPRAPCGARRRRFPACLGGVDISIHAPHAGRDGCSSSARTCWTNFNPRAPCGARRSRFSVAFPTETHFNPRAPCGARRARGSLRRGAINISIHAPHAGRDEINAAVMRSPPYFNPRAPCGARPVWCVYVDIHCTFQSTRPMRGATGFCAKMAVPMKDISIHAPHAGRDACWRESKSRERTFQSTRPMRGATRSSGRCR